MIGCGLGLPVVWLWHCVLW